MNDFIFTSEFWSWWVIVLTLGNILACWWLISFASKRQSGEVETGSVTSHTWDDDLQELNNPLPRWWLWLFHITLVFSLVYLVLYPGLGKYPGVLNWTVESNYEAEMEAAAVKFDPIFQRYASQDLMALAQDPQARKIGQRLFVNYCATCHASDAGGAPGFPNLTDADWQWGGDPETIKLTILDGRRGAMPSWKAALNDDEIKEVSAYVMSLSGRDTEPDMTRAGKTRFDIFCAACHQATGKGNTALGAPNLADDIWLYGGSPVAIAQTIANGRTGVMPAHREFLGEDKAHLLAAYVYSLSQSANP